MGTKLSQIAAAGSAPALTDQVVGVTGGTTDNLFSLSQIRSAIGRKILTANTQFYVRTDGSDSNNGLANTAGGAWATPQHAANVLAANYDLAGFTAYVNIGAGTFGGVQVPSFFGGGVVQYVGAGVASTTLSLIAGQFVGVFNLPFNSTTVLGIDAMTLSGQCGVSNGGVGNFITIGDFNTLAGVGVNFVLPAAAPGGFALALLCDSGPCVFQATVAPFTISMSAGNSVGYAFFMAYNSVFFDFGSWTVTSDLTINTAFFACNAQAVYSAQENAYSVSAGKTVTGVRFNSTNGGTFDFSQSAGGNTLVWFPGTVNGTVDSASSYDGIQGPLPGINSQTANYTLALTDIEEIIEMNLAGANTVTVPANATVAFPIGTKLWVTQTGAGATTISGAGGVTVDNAGVVGGQWKSIKLYKRGTDEWVQTTA